MRLVGVTKVERDSCEVDFGWLSVDVREEAPESQHSLQGLRTVAHRGLETAPELPLAQPKFPRECLHTGVRLGQPAARLTHENVGWALGYQKGCSRGDTPKSHRRRDG